MVPTGTKPQQKQRWQQRGRETRRSTTRAAEVEGDRRRVLLDDVGGGGCGRCARGTTSGIETAISSLRTVKTDAEYSAVVESRICGILCNVLQLTPVARARKYTFDV